MREIRFRFPKLVEHVANGRRSREYVRLAVDRRLKAGREPWGNEVWPDSNPLPPEIIEQNIDLMRGSNPIAGGVYDNKGPDRESNGS